MYSPKARDRANTVVPNSYKIHLAHSIALESVIPAGMRLVPD